MHEVQNLQCPYVSSYVYTFLEGNLLNVCLCKPNYPCMHVHIQFSFNKRSSLRYFSCPRIQCMFECSAIWFKNMHICCSQAVGDNYLLVLLHIYRKAWKTFLSLFLWWKFLLCFYLDPSIKNVTIIRKVRACKVSFRPVTYTLFSRLSFLENFPDHVHITIHFLKLIIRILKLFTVSKLKLDLDDSVSHTQIVGSPFLY